MFRHSPSLLLTLLALAGFGAAQAAAIHKWVDEKGVTHYSDAPPEQAQSPVTQLQIETGESAAKSDDSTARDHYYSIANQWQRMQQERQQREQLELQRAALKRASQPAAIPNEYRETRVTHYVTAYPRKRYRQHRKGHHRYRPVKQHTGYLQQPVRGTGSSGFPTTN